MTVAVDVNDVRVFRPMIHLKQVLSPRSRDWSDYHHYVQYVKFPGRDPFLGAFSRAPARLVPQDPEDTSPIPKTPSHRQSQARDVETHYREFNLTCRVKRYLGQMDRGLSCTLFKQYMDVVVSRGSHHSLLELKSCVGVAPKLRAREALGQLLYYTLHRGAHTFFSAGTEPKTLCIVLDRKPDRETFDWIRKLRRRLRLNLDLIWETRRGTFESMYGWLSVL